MSTGGAAVPDGDGLLASLRYLFADIIGDQDDTPPSLPAEVPEAIAPAVSAAIHMLVDYQGTGYAKLYISRLRRFFGRRDVNVALLGEIARLMAARMAYEDPIRIAQLKLAELGEAADGSSTPSADDVRKFRLDELVGALPAVVADPILYLLEWMGWLRKRLPIRFSNRNWLGIRRLKIEAALKRWRLFSVRYAMERVWVERWLHMIDRSLTKQPQAVDALVQTATMIQGYGDPYRQGMADWHAIIDGLAKPTFDGVLALPDLASAIAEARAAVMPDPRQVALKRKIAEIRARVPAAASVTAG